MNELNKRHILHFGTKKKTVLFMLISVCLGVCFSLLSFPGIIFLDSFGRWDFVFRLFGGSLVLSEYVNWLSVTPQFFMAFLYFFARNAAVFTFVQSILFFFSSLLMIDRFVSHGKLAVTSLFVICPIFFGYSVLHEVSVGCVIGINFGLLLLSNNNLDEFNTWGICRKILYVLAIVLCFYAAFGFRQNAFTIFPVILLIVFYFYKKYKNKLLSVLQTSGICLGLALVTFIPSVLGMTVLSSSSAGFVWEILSVIQDMPEEKQAQYSDYLDFIAGEGSTERALAVNDKSRSVSDWLRDIFYPELIGDRSIQSEIMRKYTNLIVDETDHFFRVKMYIAGRALGISEPLIFFDFDYDSYDHMKYFGMEDNQVRFMFVEVYNAFQEVTVIFRMPWIWFSIGLAAVIWQIVKIDRKHSMDILMLYSVAVFYYAAFLINTQIFCFRYFFPSFLILFIITADFIVTLGHYYSNKIRKRRYDTAILVEGE